MIYITFHRQFDFATALSTAFLRNRTTHSLVEGRDNICTLKPVRAQ